MAPRFDCHCSSCAGKKKYAEVTIKSHAAQDLQRAKMGTLHPHLKSYYASVHADNLQKLRAQTEESNHTHPVGEPPLPRASQLVRDLTGSLDQEYMLPFLLEDAMEVDEDDSVRMTDEEYATAPTRFYETFWQDESGDARVDIASQRSDNEDDNEDNNEDDNTDDTEAICENSVEQLLALPESQAKLRAELLDGYTCPQTPPSDPADDRASTMTTEERWSLKLWLAWKRSNGTVNAYNQFRMLMEEALSLELLSLHMVRKLAKDITGLYPTYIDVCPNNCIAFTGPFKDLEQCPSILKVKDPHKKNKYHHIACQAPRYRTNRGDGTSREPQAQMMVIPVVAKLKAMFRNAETSMQLRHRDNIMKKTLHLLNEGQKVTYRDYGTGTVQRELLERGGTFTKSAFKSTSSSPRELALAITTDGIQLTLKKESDTWVLMLIIMDIPDIVRYLVKNVLTVLITPGPKPPGNLETFLHFFFQEMACASEGLWIWDALDNAYFVMKAFLVLTLADQLGSAKLNGLVGHMGRHGDRFSMVTSARALKNGKYLYYPLFSQELISAWNPNRPEYDPANLPLRTEQDYWKTIHELNTAEPDSKKQKAIITQSGILRLPLAASSKAFIYPSMFFPSDPFHLLYENCTAWLWDLLAESGYLTDDQAARFGQLLQDANTTLPPSLCGPIRNVYLKRNSQYKIFEWMALVHWYAVPILLSLGVNNRVIDNFATFVHIVESAMRLTGHTEEDLEELEHTIIEFLRTYESIYVRSSSDIVRCRLCLLHLLHIPRHIRWFGNFRIGSQATCELGVGRLGRKVRSAKAPFKHMANIALEDELERCLDLILPDLHPNATAKRSQDSKLIREWRIPKTGAGTQEIQAEIAAISSSGLWDADLGSVDVISRMSRWGRFKTKHPNVVVSSVLSESNKHRLRSNRSSRFFEARSKIWGEAMAFYKIRSDDGEDLQLPTLVVFRRFNVKNHTLNLYYTGAFATDALSVVEASRITALVGVFAYEDKVYILRKHGALEMLRIEDSGAVTDVDEGGEDDLFDGDDA